MRMSTELRRVSQPATPSRQPRNGTGRTKRSLQMTRGTIDLNLETLRVIISGELNRNGKYGYSLIIPDLTPAIHPDIKPPVLNVARTTMSGLLFVSWNTLN
jgi:hypothetical protein